MKKICKRMKDCWQKLSEQKPQEIYGNSNSFRYIEHGCITAEDYDEGYSKKEKKEKERKEDYWSWYNV